MFSKILFYFISILIGAVFVFSAYTKIYPIEPFEFTFVDLNVANWYTAPIIARAFISLEFFLGALFILNIKIKTASKISFVVLTLFCVYLLGLIYVGNNSNCGCFGNYIVMSPLQAIIKNIIMLFIIWLIYKNHEGFNYWGKTKLIYFTVLFGSLLTPHILNYIDFNHSEAYLAPHDGFYKLQLDSLYKDAKPNLVLNNINNPKFNIKSLSNGKHVIAFMSLTCPHCRIAAKKMRIIKERNPNISMYLVLNGDDNMLKPFFNDTKAYAIPYNMLLGRNFVYLAGVNMPAIFLVNNSVVENKLNYLDLDQSEIEKWMNQAKE